MSRRDASSPAEPRVVGEGVSTRRLRPEAPIWLDADGGRVRHALVVTDPGARAARLELDGDVDPEVTVVAVAYGGHRIRVPRLTGPDAGVWSADLPPLDAGAELVVIFVIVFDDAEAARWFIERWTATASMAPPPPPPPSDVPSDLDHSSVPELGGFEATAAPAGRGGVSGALGGRGVQAGTERPRRVPAGRAPASRRPARAHIDAEMPKQLVALQRFVLRVRLSREPLIATPGVERAEAIVPIDPDKPVEVTIVTRGIRLSPRTRTTRRMRLPAAGAPPADLTFQLIPIDVGRGEVSVLVRQDPVDLPLATMRLTAKILAAGHRATSRSRVVVANARGRDADIVELPSLRVDESIVDGAATLRIAATVGSQQAFHTASIGNKPVFIDKLYARLRAIKDDVEGETDPVEQRRTAQKLLADEGRRLARRLLGAEVGALLWKHRSTLETLIVQTSAEVDLPWEIVHLAAPDGETDDEESCFLADFGLVRWVHDTARPRQILVHADRVIGVAPEYRDARLRLDRTTDEIAQLRRHLAADVLSATNADDLSAAIKTDFDLLHFAGHGRWKDTAPQGQQLLLGLFDDDDTSHKASYEDADARRDRPERVIEDPETPGPLVFLSACDVGRLQSGTAGIGGFAEAFLRGGAAVFIGCSWAVRDDVASTFVSAFYDAVFGDGQTVAEATLRARLAARRAGDLTALAFTVFAHPQAKLVPA